MKTFPPKTILIICACVLALFLFIRFGAMNLLPNIATDIQIDESIPLSSETALLNDRAPYFDLPDISGNRLLLSDFTEEPLVIVFWSTVNSESADQIKILDDYATSASPSQKDVRILGIASLEERSVVSSFMRRGGYGVVTAIDSKGAVSETYGINSLPTFFFISRDGTIREIHVGLLSAKAIGDKIEHILE